MKPILIAKIVDADDNDKVLMEEREFIMDIIREKDVNDVLKLQTTEWGVEIRFAHANITDI